MMELSVPCPYHCGVRLFLIALMIALIPMRGWVGDAMALSMAVDHTGMHATAVVPAQLPCHGAPAEAVDHAHHGNDAHGTGDGPHHSHILCDLCNGPVLHNPWLWRPAPSQPPQLLPPFSERFASQTARRDVRPPIS